MEPVSPPMGRLRLGPLCVPGVIGVVEAWQVRYAVLGPDAGWPRFQDIDDWKTRIQLVPRRLLTAELRKECGITLEEDRLAELTELDRQWEEWGARYSSDEEIASLRLGCLTRLVVVEDAQADILRARGVPVWCVGYSRVTSYLEVGIPTETGTVSAWIFAFEVPLVPGVASRGVSRDQLVELCRARWIDRVLRALSGGILSEPAVQHARANTLGPDDLVEDDVARAAREAAARMAAGAQRVNLPLHRWAQRVQLPAIEVPVSSVSPFSPDAASADKYILCVPAEDGWIVGGR